jgi:serine/threonine-protein kinase
MTPTISDRDTFLHRLRQSRLLTGEQLREIVGRLGQAPTGLELARALIGMGLLTRFQARMLLRGRTTGFFLGPYRILELVGKGGMGKVYKALHQNMNRTVALKVLSPSLMKTEKARNLFRHEVQTAARLSHLNIVTAYDANEIAGRHYLAMEHIAGATLGQLVQQRGRFPVSLACEVIRQAALGLQHAHEKGLVHRDIKPANLMVSVIGSRTREVSVKILDFGLARLHRREENRPANESIGRHPITGTPDFMSPEQARDRDAVDIRSDLYSLGCTFYYLLTGKVPFPGGGMLDKLIRHNSEVPAAPEKLRPRIPAAVAAIVLRLLAKDPADRFQTPQELADALGPHSSCKALNKSRGSHKRPAAVPVATPFVADKTIGHDRDDTNPQICLPTVVSAEHEAVTDWVQTQVAQRRRSRRVFFGVAGAVAVLAAAATAALRWLDLW